VISPSYLVIDDMRKNFSFLLLELDSWVILFKF